MGTFGEPVVGSPVTEQASPAAPAVSEEPQDLLDPNDPRLVSEELNANPEADAYLVPPPPPDKDWRVKLKIVQKEVRGEKRDYIPALWGKAPGQAVLVTGIEASIIDPSGKYDGLRAYDFNVSTFIGRDNATKVMTVLSKLRRPDGTPWFEKRARMTARAWMDLLVKALAGEPEAGIESQWEWSCPDCGKEAKAAGKDYPRSVTGMHHFPPEPDKTKRAAGQAYSPEMKCQVNGGAHGYSRARISIARFLSLDELKAK